MANRVLGGALFTIVVGVTGETVRLSYQDKHCLAVVPGSNANHRTVGASVEVRECSTQPMEHDVRDFELADLWRIDPDGFVISQMSGLCLHYADANLSQGTCTKKSSKWQVDKIQKLLKVVDETNVQCVGVVNGTVNPLLDCLDDGSAGWVIERSTLVAYPKPAHKFSEGSPYYSVTLTQGDKVYRSYVHFMETQDRDPNEIKGLTNSFVTFSFEGEVTVTVTRTNPWSQGKISNAVVRPLSSGAEPTIINDNTVEFKLNDQNQHSFKLSIELDNDWWANSLLIFGDQLETNVPAMFGEGVHYINVGAHAVNHGDLQSNEHVYVHGGAFVQAGTDGVAMLGTSTSSSLENIKVTGRGVLSGEMSNWFGDGSALVSFCGQNIEIEGITAISPPQAQVFQVNAPWYCNDGWQGNVGGAHVHNVKLMGWNYADGIIAGAKSHVHNVFTRLNDDNVKPMMSDSLYEENVHWQGGNGWAIMVAWCNYDYQSNITVRRSTVIHDDHDWDYPVDGCDPCPDPGNQASIGAVQGGSGVLENVLIEDIVLESYVLRPFWFGIEKNTWASEGTGVLKNWTVKNIQVMDGSRSNSAVWGAEDENQVQSIRFEGLTTYGTAVSTFQDARLELHGHMQNVGFDDGELRAVYV